MIAVFILRWIGGYFDFTVSGRFPERFLNLAAKNGVNIFKIKGSGDGISACAKISERKTIIRLAEKCGCSYCENREHGMPVLCRQYRQPLDCRQCAKYYERHIIPLNLHKVRFVSFFFSRGSQRIP